MKRFLLFSLTLTLIVGLVFIACSSDTEAPSATITYPATGFTTSDSVNITVEATDNEEVSKVEFIIDGGVKSTDTTAPYSFNIDLTSYSEGTHSVVAKTYDSSDNTTVSDAITINYLYDFAPSGNGKIRIAINHYLEDETLDAFSFGDPVFQIACIYNGDTTVARSREFTDKRELTNPYHYDFDLPDNAINFQFYINVLDSDLSRYKKIDYNPGEGYAYTWTTNTKNGLPFSGSYNGSDDGNASEPDCELSINVSVVY